MAFKLTKWVCSDKGVFESIPEEQRRVRVAYGSVAYIRYLEQETKQFHTYVANRVAYIRNDTSASLWSYVNTKPNPAVDVLGGYQLKTSQDVNVGR